MEWLWYSLAVVLFFSISHLLTKKATQSVEASYLNFLTYLFIAVISVLALSFFPVIIQLNVEVIISLTILGTELAFTSYLYTKSLSIGKISKTVPLLNFTPIFTVIIAFLWLGESPSLIGIGGILFIVSGAYIINIEFFSTKKIFEPLNYILKNKASRYMFIVALIYGFGSVLDKFIIVNSSVSTRLLLFSLFALPFAAIPPLFKEKNKIVFIRKSLEYIRKHAVLLAMLTLVNFIYLYMQFKAISLTLTAYPIAVKRGAALLSVVFAFFFFKEKHNFITNIVGSLLLVAGVLLLVI